MEHKIELTTRQLMHLKIILDMRFIECSEAINLAEDEWTKHEHEKQRFYAEEIREKVAAALQGEDEERNGA